MLRFFARHFARFALTASVCLFVASLFNDGYYIEASNPRAWAPAWGLLLIGWLGLAYGTFAWLGNPALLAAWILFFTKKPTLSLLAALVALAFMVSFLFQQTIVSSEAPTYSHIVGYGTGYWLWLTSAVLQVIGSAVATLQTKFQASTKYAA
jgi:hypothetical protein